MCWRSCVELAQYAFTLSVFAITIPQLDCLADLVSLLVDRRAILCKCAGVKPHLYRADQTAAIWYNYTYLFLLFVLSILPGRKHTKSE